jgi:hypothetical protein
MCYIVGVAQEYPQKTRVFLEGEVIDFNYVRRTIDFVDYVNTPEDCNVYVLITRITTAGNGKQYKMNFEGRANTNIAGYTLTSNISSTDTEEESRIKFTETLKTGLLPFVNSKQVNYYVLVENVTEDADTYKHLVKDPWNHWVFSVGMQGGIEAEEQKKEYAFNTSFTANKVTEKWRILNKYVYKRNETFIKREEDSVTHQIHTYNQKQYYRLKTVYGISNHWSAGIFFNLSQDTYRNTKGVISSKAALEYNFFDWSEADRKLFTIAYFIGPEFFEYYENTILNRLVDRRFNHTVKADVNIIQNWGSVELWMKGSQYLPDFEYYLIETGTEISLKIAKGLFLELSLEVNKIRNQFYLPAGELSEEEILLNVRKLPTSFEFSSEIGLRFMFGSIYNSLVNIRL